MTYLVRQCGADRWVFSIWQNAELYGADHIAMEGCGRYEMAKAFDSFEEAERVAQKLTAQSEEMSSVSGSEPKSYAVDYRERP